MSPTVPIPPANHQIKIKALTVLGWKSLVIQKEAHERLHGEGNENGHEYYGANGLNIVYDTRGGNTGSGKEWRWTRLTYQFTQFARDTDWDSFLDKFTQWSEKKAAKVGTNVKLTTPASSCGRPPPAPPSPPQSCPGGGLTSESPTPG